MVEGIILPTACAATCSVSVSVQRMSVEAAMKGDLDLLKLAVLHDPLVGAVCTPDEVWQMVDEMVVAEAQWLPQYAAAIPAAQARLAKATVKTRNWSGAARKPVRSVEELREIKGAHH
jgi:alpha-galactosidase